MNFKIGEINTLDVKYKSDLGYTLKNRFDNEIFLPFNQTTRDFEIGETIDVFILLDSKKRLVASYNTPFIMVDHPGFVKVTNVIKGLGIFIDNNVLKDPLVSSDDLPLNDNLWPIIDDTVLCKLKATHTQLIAKLITPEEAKGMFKPVNKLNKMDKVTAIVLKNGTEGVNLITLEGHNIFVYYKHRRRDYRIGEEVLVTINNVCDNNNYNGTLLSSKVPLMKEDADVILNYLNDNDGVMNITAKTSVDKIENTFNMRRLHLKGLLVIYIKRGLLSLKMIKLI
jgi:predicted RNA-binding protein (virulence factor B family)